MKYSKFDINLGAYSCGVHHFGQNPKNPCVILIHGSIENARIFFSRSGKGFAPWMAEQGFDVYAIDLPGKGSSKPQVSRDFQYSQTRFITRDFPLIVEDILKRNQSRILHLAAHSWGGVLIAALLARKSVPVASVVFFGSKRRISVFSLRRFLMVDLIWTLAGTAMSFLLGYLPAKAMRMGSDNEPKDFYLQTNQWVYSKAWVDPEDGFDYHASLQSKKTPPTLFLTGIHDRVLGNPVDVEKLMIEMHNPLHEFQILGKDFGNSCNYGHIDILTHPNAVDDHFPLALDWFRQFDENV